MRLLRWLRETWPLLIVSLLVGDTLHYLDAPWWAPPAAGVLLGLAWLRIAAALKVGR